MDSITLMNVSNNRVKGDYLFNLINTLLYKHNSFGSSEVPLIVQQEFFKKMKADIPKFNLFIYQLQSDLTSVVLKDFLQDFYTEKLGDNFWDCFLKLKHLNIDDLKSLQGEIRGFFYSDFI